MPAPPPLYQSALFSGAGRYPALAFYRVHPNLSDPDPQFVARRVRARTAALLKLVEESELDTQHVLVSISPDMLAGHPDPLPPHDVEPSESGVDFEFAFGGEKKAAVALQISAETAEDRVHALRLCKAVLEEDGDLQLMREMCGDVRTSYREPFGYPDSRRGHTREDVARAALVPSGPLAGSSWIFYQRMLQKLPDFFNESAGERDAIMGIDTQGDPHTGPHPSKPHARGHVTLTRAENRDADGRPIVIRRGFPFRTDEGEEGLIFVGASQAAMQIKSILEVMLGNSGNPIHDALLHYVEATHGGIFFVPANSTWLGRDASVPQPTVPKEVEAIARPGDEALLLYPFTPKGLEYMNRMRDELFFGEPVGRVDPVPNPDDELNTPVSNTAMQISEYVHSVIAGGTWTIDDLLPKMDQWVQQIGANPAWPGDAPNAVVVLVNAIRTVATPGPLTAALVRSAIPHGSPMLSDAIREANTAIASGIGTILPQVRDLVNATAHVVVGVIPPDQALKDELDQLRDDSIDASVKVNLGEGYYVTLTG